MVKKVLTALVGVMLCYSAVAFQIKVGLGTGPVDATITTIANLLGVTVGTISMIFHGSFFIGQIIIEKNKFKKVQFFQLMNITCGGFLLNFMLYIVLANFEVENFILRLIICVVSFLLSALGCDLILESHFIRTPLEGSTELIGVRLKRKPGQLRLFFDIFLVILVVIATLIAKIDWTIGIGTIISAVIFGPAMDMFRKPVKWLLRKLNVVSEKEQLLNI